VTTKRLDVSSPGFSDDDSPPASNLSSMQRAIVTIQKMRAKIEQLERTRIEPIAIVGMACRFPGGGNTPEEFFQHLEDGIDSVTEVPPERWPRGPDGPNSDGDTRALRWGSFLKDVDRFDAAFFGISPREAESLDPQHRLLLEVTWEALERAGQLPERLMGTKAGVFVGIWAPDYQLRVLARDPNDLDAYCFTGTVLSTAAGRLSYTLGVQGPCMSIDTACSSSLTAIHLACQSLRNNESSMAIAGGVNLMLAPTTTKLLSKTQALSPDGRCKTFDARANGYVRGEGCGMLVLKRLSDAERDGDSILALIRGSAVNQDGRSTGLTAPNVLSQQALLRQALENARLTPQDIAYLETHGTGTSLGDPIEVEAIKAVLGAPRERGATCVLGALKSNIGHLEAAAGVAGLIKVVLAMQHDKIPGNLHFRSLNPRIDLTGTSLEIAQTAKEWPPGVRPRYAGINSFGISGTNAHVIIEEAPRNMEEALLEEDSTMCLLPISAKTPGALRAHVAAFRDMLRAEHGPRLVDIAHTASARRSHYVHRLSVVGRTKEELADQLDAYLQGNAPAGVAEGKASPARAKIVFVFSGQGSQWIGMGRQLYESDASFRSVIDTCDNLMTTRLGWSLLDELEAPEAMSRMSETQVAQPLLFALQVALVEMLRSWGISPDAMIGHSVGEIAAAHVAGILSLDESIRLVALRGRIMQKATGLGKMVSVAMSLEDANQVLAGYEDRVAIAAINDPGSIVLSGQTAALEDVIQRCEKRGFATRPLRVDYAFHSPQMDDFERELVDRLVRVDTRRATLAMYSTVLADCVDGKELDVHYWGQNIRKPVDFAGAVSAAIRDGYQLFLEVGPHPVLTANLQQCLAQKKTDGAVIYTMRRQRDQRQTLLEAAGTLYTQGCAPEWTRITPSVGKCVPLPTYPWQRERFWVDADSSKSLLFLSGNAGSTQGEHPLLGSEFSLSTKPTVRAWQQTLTSSAPAWIAEHVVQDTIVFPGAGYVEMALSVSSLIFGDTPVVIENVSFDQMLVLPHGEERVVQVVADVTGEQGALRVASHASNADSWIEHATCRLAVDSPDSWTSIATLGDIRSRCPDPVSPAEHYARLEDRGLHYGKHFRGVQSVWLGPRDAIAQVDFPISSNDAYQVHPGQLDACFQIAALLVANALPDGPIVPIRIARIRWRRPMESTVIVHANLGSDPAPNGDLAVNCVLLDAVGNVIAEIEGFTLRLLAAKSTTTQDPLEGCIYRRQWRPLPLEMDLAQDPPGQPWLILADSHGAGRELASRLRTEGHHCILGLPGEQFTRLDSNTYQFDPLTAHDVQRLVQDAFGHSRNCRGAIHMLALDAVDFAKTTTETLKLDERRIVGSAVSLAQSLVKLGARNAPKLVFITRGAAEIEMAGAPSILHGSLSGLARTISLEHPDLECACIDLAPHTLTDEMGDVLNEILNSSGEDQIALRASGRYVGRLASATLNSADENVELPKGEPALGRRYRLSTAQPGIMDRVSLFEAETRTPGRGEVEIAVETAALNFLDVLLALGLLPDDSTDIVEREPRLGLECAGRVTAIGEGVTDLAVGDEVVALGIGAMASHVVTSRHLVAAKPAFLTWTDAGALPVVFVTAYLALARVAQLQKGERVLIHAGAGGVGMAAIQWAKHIGAEIFATAGSPEKRELLRSLGVHHALDSRSLSFVEEIRRITKGEGVDVVLNSLSGEFIPASFGLLRDYGRFVEIGKRDYYEDRALGLRPFLKNLSYTLVDLRGMMLKRPERVAALLQEVLELFRGGVFKPLPAQAFPVSSAVDAFTSMAQAKHVGKLVLSLQDSAATLIPHRPNEKITVRSDASYWITGGHGGLGLSLAQWMVEQGARNLVLIGRNAPSTDAAQVIESMRQGGANVLSISADVSRLNDVQNILTQTHSMPTVRGIVHAAAVLEDHTLTELNLDHIAKVFAPKVRGAWNLHVATRGIPMDFFVLYSSVAASLGSPGQSNYAAANACLDTLAHARRLEGLPGVSIQWGPFSDVGMAAAFEKRGERMARRGLTSLSPDEGNWAFSQILDGCPPTIGIMRFSARQWLESYPQAAGSPFLSELRKESAQIASPSTATFRDEIQRMALDLRFGAIERHVVDQLARVIRTQASRIDTGASFTSLGIDSLMSIELRNRLEASLGLKLPSTLLFTYASPAALAAHLLQELAPRAPLSVEPSVETTAPASASVHDELDLPSADDDLLAAFDASIRDIKSEISS